MPARKILIVEDEIIIAMDLEDTLFRWGFHALSVTSGEAALRHAAQDRPDLVFMDIQLAGPMDGFQAACQLYDLYGIRCLFLSAFTSPDLAAKTARLRPVGALAKPVPEHTLRELLSQTFPDLRLDAPAPAPASVR